MKDIEPEKLNCNITDFIVTEKSQILKARLSYLKKKDDYSLNNLLLLDGQLALLNRLEKVISLEISTEKENDIRQLEIIMSKFGEAHNLLAKTKLPKEQYNPISNLMATAKAQLFFLYQRLKILSKV